uniref:Uncharacterized protein n=1 Tax=Arundo donax TaxID=35708 RepID=A0A0A9DRV6_ARUDO
MGPWMRWRRRTQAAAAGPVGGGSSGPGPRARWTDRRRRPERSSQRWQPPLWRRRAGGCSRCPRRWCSPAGTRWRRSRPGPAEA